MTAAVPSTYQNGAGGFARASAVAKRQWWIVILCALIATIGAFGYSKVKKVTYTARTVLAVAEPGSASTAGTSATSSTTPDSPAQDISAASVRRAAAKAAHLSSVPLSAALNTASTSVTITATAPSAGQAVAAANAAATAYAAKQRRSYLAQAASYQQQIDSLSSRINALSRALKADPRNQADKTKLSVLNTQLSTLLTNQYLPQQAAADVRVTTSASSSTVGANTTSHKVILLALVAGLLAGLGIALIREQLDDKLRAPTDVADGEHEVLAELPISPPLRQTGTIADDPSGQLAEAVRALRTALRFLSVKRSLRTVLVTSATSGDGKSFVALNLATALAMSGRRTVLVSSDLRQPTVEATLGLGLQGDGLSEAIADAAVDARRYPMANGRPPVERNGNDTPPAPETSPFNLDELLLPTSVEGLAVLPAGPTPPNPAELLGSSQMASLLGALHDVADVVVLDSPPVLAVTDALVLTAHADGVLFVAAQNHTSRSAVQRGLKALESGLAPVLGIVLDRATRSDDTSYFQHTAKRRLGAQPPAPAVATGPDDPLEAPPSSQPTRTPAYPAKDASSPTTS